MQANPNQGQGVGDVELRRALDVRIRTLLASCDVESLLNERLQFTAGADNPVKEPTRIGEDVPLTELRGIRIGDDDDEVFVRTIDIYLDTIRLVAGKLGFQARDYKSESKENICQKIVTLWMNNNNTNNNNAAADANINITTAAADDSDEGEGEDEDEESDEEEDDENDNIFNNNNINNTEDEEDDVSISHHFLRLVFH